MYQIYPRSFKDSNGDGVGDLAGIIEKLSYLQDTLGVDACWISPFYPSPQADCGYDISDYCGVDPMFGTLDDADLLISTAHSLGIKIVLDLVPNHTSDQHPWFQEARASLDNPKRDWYVWRNLPNNWVSISGGSSWAFDQATGQYYLHSFLPSQPDLNWENPEVRAAIKDVMRFWFEKGVDGFRVDAVWVLSKDTSFQDDPLNNSFDGPAGEYGSFIHKSCKYGPRLQEYLDEIATVAEEFEDKRIFFEFYPDEMLGDVNEQLALVHSVRPAVAAPFYFEGLHTPWHADHFGRLLRDYLKIVPQETRPVFCFSNHDQPRLVGRYQEEQARVISFMQMTLPGMPTMYYGDELGMENGAIPPELTKDKFEKTGDSGGRDPERTPMQWEDSPGAGFTTGMPWLPIHENVVKRNVFSEENDMDSWLNFYKRLLVLRREAAISYGSFELVDTDSGYILAYKRILEQTTYYAVLNFADAAQIVSLPVKAAEVVIATHLGAAVVRDDGRISLQGFTAALVTAWPE